MNFKRLKSYTPPPPRGSGNAVGNWVMKNIFRQSLTTKIPKGVYLWGTVGGGKTMIMDLFYDTVLSLQTKGPFRCVSKMQQNR